MKKKFSKRDTQIHGKISLVFCVHVWDSFGEKKKWERRNGICVTHVRLQIRKKQGDFR